MCENLRTCIEIFNIDVNDTIEYKDLYVDTRFGTIIDEKILHPFYKDAIFIKNKVKPFIEVQNIYQVNNTFQVYLRTEQGDEKTEVKFYQYDKSFICREYDPTKIYIMKKNIQRQEGLKITNNKNQIINGVKNGYVVVQELLQDPYMINGRKINMRFYVLVVCQNNEISAFVHKEGFMYYTKMPFKQNSMKDGHNITSGYIERWIYDVNPLTHGDFRKYLGDKSVSTFNNIYELIKKVILTVDDKLCHGSHLKEYITFQLFGVDIALNNKLIPQIMEINVGPNLGIHDKRDGEIKKMVIRDTLKILKVVDDKDNGFIEIL